MILTMETEDDTETEEESTPESYIGSRKTTAPQPVGEQSTVLRHCSPPLGEQREAGRLRRGRAQGRRRRPE